MHPDLPALPVTDWLNTALFGFYPYICLAVMVIGSVLRFDREQYTWRTGSSQLLRRKQLMWGSNLFHLGILFLFLGHSVGLLTPHSIYSIVITAEAKQLLAIIAGSIAGAVCFIGLTLLMHRRFFDARIRRTSTFGDNAVLVILWVQLSLGLATVPFSLAHDDASVMLRLSSWAQGILTFKPDSADLVRGLDWPYQAHLLLGLTIFLLFPFTRLVHILSAPVWFLGRRGWQLVRTRHRDMPTRLAGGLQSPAE
ncbi:MAG TPA: respiratory nitrate reductase subunit gamma [Hyphomonadaceae bacterium]|nr:respiratory nitrate reductase subunit gamma [Hyphomonadaceae bacterium]